MKGETILIDSPMSGFDLERQFRTTGLAKGAFASMLRFDRALIVRLIEQRRAWKPGEAITARAFFALVPEGIDERFRDAVQQLTRSDKLARVESAIDDDPRSRPILEGYLLQGAAKLRADHVVHMCRVAKIDLTELVERGLFLTETRKTRLALFDPNVDKTYARAAVGEFLERRHGKKNIAVAMEIRQKNAVVDRESSRSQLSGGPAMQPGPEIDRVSLDRCTTLVVSDSSLEPRYRRGEIILVEPVERGFRHGDDVVLELEDGLFEVGRLVIQGRDELVIEHPRGGNLSIRRNSIRSTRRIAFVAR
jgi:hypothetical protein